MESTIQYIPIDLLDDHPDNPRLIVRQDVVDGIAAQIEANGDFDPAHALMVRPQDERYQIIWGHHRKLAVIQAGLTEVPCWVRETTDDEAYLQLGFGNAQGEWKPIEIGLHALGLPEERGGRGKKGGLREYARQMGQNQGNVVTYKNGAEVLRSLDKSDLTLNHFLDKAAHLAAIHKTPEELWPMLAEWLFTLDGHKKQRSVKQIGNLVKEVQDLLAPIRGWRCFFLPYKELTERFIEAKEDKERDESNIQQVNQLVQLAYQTRKDIKTHRKKLDPKKFTYTVEDYFNWLRGGTGTYSWSVEKLKEYYKQMQAMAEEAAHLPEIHPREGGWYGLGEHLLYCGDTSKEAFWGNLPQVPFAFADPPYNEGVADWDEAFDWNHDWLTEKAEVVAVTPGIVSIQDFFKIRTEMPYVWSLAGWAKNGMTRGALGFGNWIFTAIFCENKADLPKQKQDFIQFTISTLDTEQSAHKGRKPPEYMQKILKLFSRKGDIVIDPFLGSGTSLFEAHKLGRKCIGGEIRPDFCKEILDRWQEDTKIAVEIVDGNIIS